MNVDKNKDTEQYLTDTITERPYGFSVGERHFYLYPVTLGKMYILQKYIELMAVDKENIRKNLYVEAIRLAKEKRDICLNVIYIHTCKTKDEIFDTGRQAEITALFNKEMTDDDVAALTIIVLSADKTDTLVKQLGIEKEQRRMRITMDEKNEDDKSNLTFGGVSIYGSFIYPLLELGISWNEILWERSYTNLRLLLSDKVNSVFVTDTERKKIPAWVFGNGQYIKADDPKNKEMIKAMSWK